ncbi:MAG: lamin tail domain-containing protein [Oscillospiraceae bacterium]|nr:MAG: lamin tail domain-containing protein [Oscillospiraceae bacterium]
MKIKLTALALMTVMVCTVLCGCELFEQGTQQPGPQGSTSSVYITEIVSRNESTLADDDGEYSDYIELYNSSSSRVALKGYYLSDNDKAAEMGASQYIY